MSTVESARRRMRQGKSAVEELIQRHTRGDESVTIKLAGGELWDSLHWPSLQWASWELLGSKLQAPWERACLQASCLLTTSELALWRAA